jgi:hypothetical protein
MGLFFGWGPSSNVAMGRLNQLWISDKAQDDLPMAVVDYKNALEFNGTIPENSILKPVRIKFLQNMVMLDRIRLYFKVGFVGKCIISIRTANFE